MAHEVKPEIKTKDEEIADLRRLVSDLQHNRGGGKGAGKNNKGGGKGRTHGATIPAALQPGVARMTDGTPICFAFNLDGCNQAKPGQRCPRGMHVCTKIGCQGNHAASQCRR